MDDQPFFFCHIPKTAGSTFADILENIFPQDEICPAYYTFELNNLTASQLESYRLFRGHIDYHVLCQFLPQRPKTLTFIRNPFDHAISIFSHLLCYRTEISKRRRRSSQSGKLALFFLPSKVENRRNNHRIASSKNATHFTLVASFKIIPTEVSRFSCLAGLSLLLQILQSSLVMGLVRL